MNVDLVKIDKPKFHLSLKYDRSGYNVVDRKQACYVSLNAIGNEFFIASGHFDYHDFLSNDLTWGIAKNILFTVTGYCELGVTERDYTLVCKIVDMY